MAVTATRATRAVRLGLVFVLLVAILTACASDSKQVLHGLKSLPILNQLPPGGEELGRAQDQGTIAGDQAGIAVVYVSNRSALELARYYETTYPAYSLRHDTSADYGPAKAPTYAEIGSFRVGNVEATVSIRVRVDSPDLSEQGLNYDLKLKRAPAGATTFVTVNVIGFVPRHIRSS
jgi:hypothetical protein